MERLGDVKDPVTLFDVIMCLDSIYADETPTNCQTADFFLFRET